MIVIKQVTDSNDKAQSNAGRNETAKTWFKPFILQVGIIFSTLGTRIEILKEGANRLHRPSTQPILNSSNPKR